MSLYTIEKKYFNPTLEIDPNNLLIAVGWHEPLTTYAARVVDISGNGNVMLEIGTTRNQIKTIYELRETIAEYATIPQDIVRQCQEDSGELFSLLSWIDNLFNL